MRRRQFLALGGVAAGATLAGCQSGTSSGTTPTESGATTSASSPAETGTTADGSTPETTADPFPDKPEGVYVQTFRERMSMQGTASASEYKFALMFTVPHTFWTVTGDTLSKVPKTDDDSVHLMATVWDPDTGTVVPETGLSVEITRDGSLVSQETIYPMLSQPMSFHYGGNFQLEGDGTYTVTVSVGGVPISRTGAFEGRFGDPASAEIQLEFTEETRGEVRSRPIDRGGEPGALRPMDMMTPQSRAPGRSALPGTVRGSAMSDDARFVVTTVPGAGTAGSDETYLAVSARTRYNGYVLPAMALSGTLDRDGTTVFDGPLERTLDPDLGYHYGAAVDAVESGDELTLSVTTPPQVARHEGYETAFRQFEDVTVSL